MRTKRIASNQIVFITIVKRKNDDECFQSRKTFIGHNEKVLTTLINRIIKSYREEKCSFFFRKHFIRCLKEIDVERIQKTKNKFNLKILSIKILFLYEFILPTDNRILH